MSQNLKNNPDEWYSAKVIRGTKIGRTVNIPTVNLDNPGIMKKYDLGVYAAKVKIKGEVYQGSLYYGPKTINKETFNSLEIHIFDFQGDLYGKEISFHPLQFIRPPIVFNNLDKMKKSLKEDNRKIRMLLREPSQRLGANQSPTD